MVYTTFNRDYSDINREPMFLGKSVNTFRTDIKRYSFLNDNIWNTNNDININSCDTKKENKEFITKILQFLISINSTQSRGISIALLQLASLPEVENFIQKCSFIKLNHLIKYNQLLKIICSNPTLALDDITKNKNIARISKDFGIYYDLLILDIGFLNTRGEGLYFVSGNERRVNKFNIKKELLLAIVACYATECIKNKKNHKCLIDYCTENKIDNIISLSTIINNENNIIIENFKNILNLWKNNKDDPDMSNIYFKYSFNIKKIFIDIINEEILSLEYLFDSDNKNKNIVVDTIYDLAKKATKDIDLELDI